MGAFFGLDIGSNEIKALQASKLGGGYKVDRFAAQVIAGKDPVEVIKAVIKKPRLDLRPKSMWLCRRVRYIPE